MSPEIQVLTVTSAAFYNGPKSVMIRPLVKNKQVETEEEKKRGGQSMYDRLQDAHRTKTQFVQKRPVNSPKEEKKG